MAVGFLLPIPTLFAHNPNLEGNHFLAVGLGILVWLAIAVALFRTAKKGKSSPQRTILGAAFALVLIVPIIALFVFFERFVVWVCNV